MTSLKDLRLYTTVAHDCSYLPGKKAKTLFIDPDFIISTEFHTRLTEIGFRRSGAHIYRPHCPHCQGCIPCRIVVDDFKVDRRFSRTLKKNRDLEVRQVESIADDVYFNLYRHYIDTRHSDGDMYPASREQYESFLVNALDDTIYYAITDNGKLVGVMICDRLTNALSAVFTFYDCTQAHRSLGTFGILWQIEEARRQGLPYLYLGYWIKDCAKMNYKSQFRPLELLNPQGWEKMT